MDRLLTKAKQNCDTHHLISEVNYSNSREMEITRDEGRGNLCGHPAPLFLLTPWSETSNLLPLPLKTGPNYTYLHETVRIKEDPETLPL